MKKSKKKNFWKLSFRFEDSRGFTLIETLIAMVIFTLISSASIGLFIFAIRSQSKALAFQKVSNEASYAMEYMGRYLRMAKKELNCQDPANDTLPCFTANPFCLNASSNSGYGFNYEVPNNFLVSGNYTDFRIGSDSELGSGIRFIDSQGKCRSFYALNGVLYQSIQGTTPDLPITSSNVLVSYIRFSLQGEAQSQPVGEGIQQPRVTITLGIQKRPELTPEIKIQTTISQREVDIIKEPPP